MSAIDDDLGSQEGGEAETQPLERTVSIDAERQKLLREWAHRFESMEYDWNSPTGERYAARAWKATHVREDLEIDDEDFRGTRHYEIFLKPIAGCVFSTRDQAFARFARYSDALRLKLDRLDAQNRPARKPSEIADVVPEYLLQGAIPMRAGSMIFGHRKHGKSAWAQKLAVCVSHGLPFDGEPIKHGRVIYKTLDPDAGEEMTKHRMRQICDRLGIALSDRYMRLDDTPLNLADPVSVDSFLVLNPGRFALIVLDPLYRLLPGDPSRADLAKPMMDGIDQIIRATGAAVLIAHHDPRNSGGRDAHPHGSVFIEAGLSGLMHITRGAHDKVTLTPQFVKNGIARGPIKYELQAAFLEAIDPDAPVATPGGPLKHPDMLALMPTTATPRKEARKLIEAMLTAPTPEAKRKQWNRICEAWRDAGAVILDADADTIRRV
jgi:hypothetical protein